MALLIPMIIPAIVMPLMMTAQNSSVTCVEGLKMFVSRATEEEMGLGATGSLVKTIAERINGSNYEPILYPATRDWPPYFQFVGNGTRLVKNAVTDYANACPDSKMALFGYSQGAQITANSLCGMPLIWGLEAGFDPRTEMEEVADLSLPLPTDVTENIVSVVLFGDPSFTNHTSFNHGSWNNTGNGMFSRASTHFCEALGNRVRSYCDAGDPFCDIGDYVDPRAHLVYIDVYGEEIVDFVIKQYENGGRPDSDGNSSSSEQSGDGDDRNAARHLVPVSGLALTASLAALITF